MTTEFILNELNKHYYTLHIFLLYESNKTIWMFYEKFDDEGDNPSIYIAEGDNRLSHGPQPLTTGSVLKIPSSFFSVQFHSCIF